ncbi:MAG: RNA 2',3'-cyclic phosphodiesterase [bacterium]
MRAFLAVPLPPDFRPAVESLQENLGSLSALGEFRWIPAGNVHLTLRFLGEIGEEEARAAGDALEAAAAEGAEFELRLERFGVFPHLKSPNVLWAGPNEVPPALAALAGALGGALEEAGFPREGRPFQAHLTLGRRRGRGRAPAGLEGELEAAESRWLQPPPSFRTAEAALFRSDLRPSGAIYTPVRQVALPKR